MRRIIRRSASAALAGALFACGAALAEEYSWRRDRAILPNADGAEQCYSFLVERKYPRAYRPCFKSSKEAENGIEAWVRAAEGRRLREIEALPLGQAIKDELATRRVSLGVSYAAVELAWGQPRRCTSTQRAHQAAPVRYCWFGDNMLVFNGNTLSGWQLRE